MNDMSRLLTDLSNLSVRLNQESDALTDLVARFETVLCDLKLGVEVSLQKPISSEVWVDEKNHVEGVTKTHLGFCKGDQGWGLYVWKSEHDEATPDTERHLRDASRDDRIAAVEHFPALLKAMKEQAEEVIGELQRVNKSTNFPATFAEIAREALKR